MAPRPNTDWERYEAQIDTSDGPLGCWNWTGRLSPAGYPRAMFSGRRQMVYRWAYEQVYGPVPQGLECDHACRNRKCVNPGHINAVTRSENMRNIIPELRGGAFNKRKTHCPKGHPYSGNNLRVGSNGGRGCKTCVGAAVKAKRDAAWAEMRERERCRHCRCPRPRNLIPVPLCSSCVAVAREWNRAYLRDYA